MWLDNTVSTDVRDATIWRAAKKFTADGVPGHTINAGLDWNGMYATTGTDRPAGNAIRGKYRGQHWTLIFPEATDCYIVTFTPVTYRSWILVYRTRGGPYGFHRGKIHLYGYYRTTCAAVPR